jgi:hypothetical protein
MTRSTALVLCTLTAIAVVLAAALAAITGYGVLSGVVVGTAISALYVMLVGGPQTSD